MTEQDNCWQFIKRILEAKLIPPPTLEELKQWWEISKDNVNTDNLKDALDLAAGREKTPLEKMKEFMTPKEMECYYIKHKYHPVFSRVGKYTLKQLIREAFEK